MSIPAFENKIFAINTDVLKDEKIFRHYYELQRPERRSRIDSMKFDNGKRLTLGAGIVMEAALEHAGCPGAPVVVLENGKPVVDGRTDEPDRDDSPDVANGSNNKHCYFNISDTKNIAICAVSDKEVGIDIEHTRELKDPLIRRAFTPDEISYAESLPEDNQLLYYTRLWTVKESVMKWYGLGFLLPPEDINIIINNTDLSGDISPDIQVRLSERIVSKHDELDRNNNDLKFTLYTHEDCLITVCSEYSFFTDKITYIKR